MDVLCVGHASYDLMFQVPHHPAADEKTFATGFLGCGGGPAANAAVTVAKAGARAAFAGYLGNDLFGQRHGVELREAGVRTDWIVRGDAPTPLSAVLVKPDGRRALVNYRGDSRPLAEGAIDFSACRPKAILFDGHEPLLSPPLACWAKNRGIPTVLDAGSVHAGTEALMGLVDHLVCSEKFALQATGHQDPETALKILLEHAPVAVITLGDRGLAWAKRDGGRGRFPAYRIGVVDTTGAGDVFHGAYALCVAERRDWNYTLRYANAAAALNCTALGARPGIPSRAATEALIAANPTSPDVL